MSSDSNLTVRLLRELHAQMAKMGERMDKMSERLDDSDEKLEDLRLTVSGMAAYIFGFPTRLADHERRLRKLESRPTK